jgi:DNA-binding response OmpR family regulator
VRQPERPPARDTGKSRLILVVEDEVLIALEVEAVLLEQGFLVLGPATTVEAALTLIAKHQPDAAILDVNLRGELVSPVAEALRYRGVPFLTTSAHGHPDQVAGAVLAGVPHLGKPTSSVTLLTALRTLLG